MHVVITCRLSGTASPTTVRANRISRDDALCQADHGRVWTLLAPDGPSRLTLADSPKATARQAAARVEPAAWKPALTSVRESAIRQTLGGVAAGR